MREAIDELVTDVDVQPVSVAACRRQVSAHVGEGEEGLESRAEQVNAAIQEAVQNTQSEVASLAEYMADVVADLGPEDRTCKRMVYLITFSHVLPDIAEAAGLRDLAGVTREALATWCRLAFDEPAADRASGPGMKRLRLDPVVRKVAVFQERHASGEPHFHAAVSLSRRMRWMPAKRTLRERDGLAAHFSATHSQFWSAVRYGFIGTLKKPNVDQTPYVWSSDGSWPCGAAPPGSPGWSSLFEASQEPWCACAWKVRAQKGQKQAAERGAKAERFTKLDLAAIVIANDLHTKADVMAYAQDLSSVRPCHPSVQGRQQ